MIHCPRSTIDTITEGDAHSFEVTICGVDVDRFSELSGDNNSLHVDRQFAQKRGFAGRVVHGAFLVGLLSRMVGMHLPGENALLQKIDVKFLRPAYINDKISINAQVVQVSTSMGVVVLRAEIRNLAKDITLLTGKIQVGIIGPEDVT